MAILGDVRCFVQANNGDVLLGTNDAARIYKSSDNGQTWTQVISFASTASVSALVKDTVGNLFATVLLGGSTGNGIWRSTNSGANWTRVKAHPNNNGYYDITVLRPNNRLVAVSYGSSASQMNLASSTDGGTVWVDGNVGTTLKQLTAHRVASSELGTLAWFGFESITPMTTLTNPGGGALSTYQNTIPSEGMDVAIFNYTQSDGRIEEIRLWAAKNGSNTEIYRYASVHLTDLGIFTTGWGLVTTIPNAVFNGVYVDPLPAHTALNRTLWAGVDGAIYVSYNNGAVWALATSIPVGQMYAFIRTVSGVLIAGGQNGEIFLFSGGSGSEGGGEPPDEEEETGGSAVVNAYLLGRAATCEDEVYVSNKSSFSNMTHVIYYNGSTYSELQFLTQPPYSLLGNTPAVNHAVYFGSMTSDLNVPGGPFSSLIFDITEITEDTTIVWQYWNGSAWATLTVQDNTSGFKIEGVNSVHWLLSNINWATTAVNGITGYWVRARVSAVDSAPTGPIHDNRYIYTINLPFIEIANTEIRGDIPALAKIHWRNRADNISNSLSLQIDRFICGLRSLGRGTNFNAYFNVSDVQTLFGFAITKDVDGVWASDQRAPTNRRLIISYASAGRLNTWNDLVTFTLSNTIARDYYGRYRVFVRCYKYGAGANTWQLRIRTRFGSGGSKADCHHLFPTTGVDWEILDFGQIAIPTTQISQQAGNLGDQLSIAIQGYNTSLGVGLALYDMILIPIDEWAVDAKTPEVSITATAEVKGSYYMDVDSISNPKLSVGALNRNSADQIVSRYQTINNGPVILQKESDQRIWFLGMAYENYWKSVPEIAATVQVFKQQQYLGFRGNR